MISIATIAARTRIVICYCLMLLEASGSPYACCVVSNLIIGLPLHHKAPHVSGAGLGVG